ncbi:Xylose isomerase domain-containing protein TIM barrel [Emticicia oligotrophica DSM 17448]|uniref:Xylose isomerase domain-containing protein TIM barrel n=1 Tax=Emticicia oligotrophica (strain DSM 17448 / CIP 109782 / MTCC 6937 / GPTSA100-15) TaxID=929562 RepID=A0ABM5MXM8_EMTOG|nr:sugar phosphate isomerase/epimerase family protein [Emticicia oligotrophica]AFK01874.1 Xylose isomerase domain-containing protein TIM barrel [Emticicia oligotrophica DSM 17448]
MERREFLQKGALALAGTAAFSSDLFANKKAKHVVGVQLYSIREDMKKDPLGSLKKLAEMGYTHVEHANYIDRKFYGYTAKEFRKILDDLGLKMPSGHTVMGKQHWDEGKGEFTDLWKYTIEDAAICGQKYVVSPWLDVSLRKNFDDLKRFMEVFNKSGELCKKSGMKFGYHNHDFEFSLKLSSVKVYDIMLQNTDPSLVAQQLDIGNMYGGGGRAAELLKQYPGRFELMHVKDEIKSEKEHGGWESAILGTGVIGVKEIIDMGKKSGGTTQFIIEQESYQGKAPLDCMKEDLAIMKKWGY